MCPTTPTLKQFPLLPTAHYSDNVEYFVLVVLLIGEVFQLAKNRNIPSVHYTNRVLTEINNKCTLNQIRVTFYTMSEGGWGSFPIKIEQFYRVIIE